jgi:stage V sporulation protein R
MLFMLTNHAQPYVYVLDGNYHNRGELYLGHRHCGLDLDIKYAQETLKRPAGNLETPGAHSRR